MMDLEPELRQVLEADSTALRLYQDSIQYRMTVDLWSHLLCAVRDELHSRNIAPEIASDILLGATQREMRGQREAAEQADTARRLAMESISGLTTRPA